MSHSVCEIATVSILLHSLNFPFPINMLVQKYHQDNNNNNTARFALIYFMDGEPHVSVQVLAVYRTCDTSRLQVVSRLLESEPLPPQRKERWCEQLLGDWKQAHSLEHMPTCPELEAQLLLKALEQGVPSDAGGVWSVAECDGLLQVLDGVGYVH